MADPLLPDPEKLAALLEQEAVERAAFGTDQTGLAAATALCAARPAPAAPATERTEGWETRLAAALERFHARPYRLGENDCFRLACAVLEALTGQDRWPEFDGRYASRRAAISLIRTYADAAPEGIAGSLESPFDVAFSGFFGVGPCSAGYARRGDIVKVCDANGTAHLGVCLGAQIAVYREQGVAREPRESAVCCWRIG